MPIRPRFHRGPFPRTTRPILPFLLLLTLLLAATAPARATIDTIYVIQLTHLDIGFTAPPDDVAAECKMRIDQVLGLLDTWPQFIWTIESTWQVEQWLARTPDPTEVEHLFDQVRAGRISLGGAFANMHTSMLGPEEMNRIVYPAHRIRTDHDVAITTAFLDDVPGASWAIPQALARSGITCLVTGPNTSFGGAPDIPMADRPFYFEGPDGSRVLTWRGYGNYLEGSFDYALHGSYGVMEQAVLGRIAEWEATGYPWDAILVIDGTGDNGMADRAVEVFANIDRWNAEHTAQIRLSAPEAFFEHMEAIGAGTFTVYSGDAAGAWEAVNAITPATQATARLAGDRIRTAETLAAIGARSGAPWPTAAADTVYHDLLAVDEHSGGGVGWPGLLTLEEIERSNEIHFETASAALAGADSILDGALRTLAAGLAPAGPGLVLFNPVSWRRTDVVRARIPAAAYEGAFILRDGVTMAEIPYQRVGNRTIAFVADDMPACGYRIDPGEPVPDPPVYPDQVLVSHGGRSLENEFYRVTVGPSGLAILDKETGRGLVDATSEFRFNGLIRANQQQDFFGRYMPLPFGTASITASPGPVLGEIAVDFDTFPIRRTRVTLYAGIRRIEIENTVDRARMRYVPYETHSEHYSLLFPFDLDLAGGLRAAIDDPNFVLDPSTDYLPGATVGHFVSQHAIDLREAMGFGVTIANRESFLNEIGGPAHHNLDFDPPEATVVAKLVQKADESLTADQGIVAVPGQDGGIEVIAFHHAITTSTIPPGSLAMTVPEAALHFGEGFDRPIEAAFLSGEPPRGADRTGRVPRGPVPGIPAEREYFRLSSGQVALVTVRRSTFDGAGDTILRLQEIVGRPATGVELRASPPFTSAERVTTLEEPVPGGALPVDPILFDIGAHETLTIRAR